MKILYLSCHAVLEYDEVSLLHELGHEVFSPGAYLTPSSPGVASLRPGLVGITYDEEILAAWHALAARHPGQDAKVQLTKQFVDHFDCVIVMHTPHWVEANWHAMGHKRVIWRTIGQSIQGVEDSLRPFRNQGLEIVRYSPRERRIPGYIGEDAMIRFYKDPDEFKNWTGHERRVITFSQQMKTRDVACNFSLFESVTRPFERRLFGPGNEEIASWAFGAAPFERLKAELRSGRAYFYTGTHPASYTLNFVEAWLTGIPIVAIGPLAGNASYFPKHELYEIPDLIVHGSNGFISDDPAELRQAIQLLLEDDLLATGISRAAQVAAQRTFGKNTIMPQWQQYLG